jgi:hypothetical protein
MPYLRLAIYVMVSMSTMLGAQLTRSSEQRLAVATVVTAQLKALLSGFSLYVINNSNNLVLSTPAPIGYSMPNGSTQTVANVLSPTANELMLLGFLASPTVGATAYPAPTVGGAYQTALTLSPTGCQGNACTIELYVWLSSPVGGSTSGFDIHYLDNQSLAGNISMGYTLPSQPSVVHGPHNSWSYSLTNNTLAGIPMIHTYLGASDFMATYPCVVVACWKSPSSLAASFPTRSNTVGDARLEQMSGGLYFWTGASWRNFNSNSAFTSYLGSQSGNTGSNNTFLGNSSGQALYVSP